MHHLDAAGSADVLTPSRVLVTPAVVDPVLAALTLPRIQPQQHHQAVKKPFASHSPKLQVSALGTGPHTHLNTFAIFLQANSGRAIL